MSKPDLKTFCEEAETLFLPTILAQYRNRDIAADIFQKTMLHIIEKYDELESPEAYGWKIISNLKKKKDQEYYRDKKYDSLSDETGTLLVLADNNFQDPESMLAAKQYNEFLNKAINSLSPHKRDLMIDYLTRGKSYDKKTKSYVGMSVAEFCEKHNMSKSLYHETIQDLKNSMLKFMGMSQDTTVYEERRRN
jgi:RNA polymerase sigma factor (sigma-70 family)